MVPLPPPAPGAGLLLLIPGRSAALWLTTLAIHGPLPAGATLDLHPFALAAWVGLLATALNLLPLGQLDGGHILYAFAPGRQRAVSWVAFLALWPLGAAWPGWWVWAALVFLVGRGRLAHPPVFDAETPLDGRRRWLAGLAAAVLLLTFVPRPFLVLA